MRYGARKLRNRMRRARIRDVYEELRAENNGPVRIISWDFTIVGEKEDEILFVVCEVEAHPFGDIVLDAKFRWAVYINGRARSGG